MKVELGAYVVVADIQFAGADGLYHLPGEPTDGTGRVETLCGLDGPVLRYVGPLRDRRACAVCRAKAPALVEAAEPVEVWTYEKVTGAQLEVLHRVYDQQGLSVRQVAERVWERLGYASVQSCAVSLQRLFHLHGYQLRGRQGRRERLAA